MGAFDRISTETVLEATLEYVHRHKNLQAAVKLLENYQTYMNLVEDEKYDYNDRISRENNKTEIIRVGGEILTLLRTVEDTDKTKKSSV